MIENGLRQNPRPRRSSYGFGQLFRDKISTRPVPYHEKCRPGRNGGAFPHNVLDTYAGQRHRNDGPEPEHLLTERLDKLALFVMKAVFPGVATRVRLLDVVEQILLE